MRLGIDFGTTHTVVAAVDRGNYPVIGFDWGDALPSVVAARDGELRFGREAEEVADEPGWDALRSFKRRLRGAGPLSAVELGGRSVPLADLLAGYFERLRLDLEASSADCEPGEPLEVAVSVPANASNDQRFLTLDAFRRAGFEVVTLLNEPSAAGFEYGHRFRRTLTKRREHVLVYDMGGGTFDASLIRMTGRVSEVITSSGVPELGGSDFDAAILSVVLASAGLPAPGPREHAALLEGCRRQKEALQPQSRRLVVDLTPLGRAPVVLPVDEVYAACAPLVERSLAVLDETLQKAGSLGGELAGVYVVGGASGLPSIPRQLRERYGQRVKRSPHPFAATAIGLACHVDEEAGYEVSDVLTRHFGVWRETAWGHSVAFDPVFARDARLPAPGAPPLVSVRRYRPAHNLGHFRFVECGGLRDGHPDGDVIPWDGIWFPFDRALRERPDLHELEVARLQGEGPEIEERYECSSSGLFRATLTCLDDGWSQSYQIARRGAPAVPAPSLA